jgi:hypothetical protein
MIGPTESTVLTQPSAPLTSISGSSPADVHHGLFVEGYATPLDSRVCPDGAFLEATPFLSTSLAREAPSTNSGTIWYSPPPTEEREPR